MAPAPAHPRQTDSILSWWRCGDTNGAYPLFSGIGAGLYPGRWNSQRSPMIYAADHFSTALLEKLLRLNGLLPPGMHAVEILAPPGVSIEYFDPLSIPGWIQDLHATRQHGDDWFHSGRSLALRVPSVAASAIDHNILINPSHPDFARLQTRTPFPVHWDRRLFQPQPA